MAYHHLRTGAPIDGTDVEYGALFTGSSHKLVKCEALTTQLRPYHAVSLDIAENRGNRSQSVDSNRDL